MNSMNQSKVYAYMLATLTIIFNILDAIHTMVPAPWSAVITAVLSVATFYHIYQSHTDAALGAAGYYKNQAPTTRPPAM